MNIIYANNHNYIRGGAEKVYFDEINMFKAKGHKVAELSYNDNNSIKYENYNEELLDDFNMNIFKKLGNIFWNYEAATKLEKKLTEKKYQIFHGHNIHTRLSPSIIFKAKEYGLKTIITLHDLKYVCPHYTMLHNNKICEDCKGGSYYHALLNRCHKNSYVKSAIVAAELYNFQRLKLYDNVDAFITPSLFFMKKYKEMGFKGKIVHIPNFIEVPKHINTSTISPKNKNYLFVGRLSYEKGILVLLEAFKNNKFTLDIVGDGPLKSMLIDYVNKNNFQDRVNFYGHLPTSDVLQMVVNAQALIIPSEWYENAPITILEALSVGKIVLGSDLGGIPEMVHDSKNGFLFASGRSDEINDAIMKCESLSDQKKKEFSDYSLELVNTTFSKKAHYKNLMKLYEEVQGNTKLTV